MSLEIELTGKERLTAFYSFDQTSKAKKYYGKSLVYFLILKNELVYIGCSSSLYNRLLQHRCESYEAKKYFDSYMFLEYENIEFAREMEKFYIIKYGPILNKTYNKQNLQK